MSARGPEPSEGCTRLLTVNEVAARWQVRPQHVYGLVQRGGVPHVRIGRYVRFRLEAVERWERQQEDAPHA